MMSSHGEFFWVEDLLLSFSSFSKFISGGSTLFSLFDPLQKMQNTTKEEKKNRKREREVLDYFSRGKLLFAARSGCPLGHQTAEISNSRILFYLFVSIFLIKWNFFKNKKLQWWRS